MTALGYMATRETIVGWRCWRVLPYHELDGSLTYRLCAVGTLGVPKVWTPRRPVEAVCSNYTSEHAAPWPDCECGVWGLERSASARRRMILFMQTQSEPAAWAWGQVSLWGRVIEHEAGWRGQYAYPFAITVESGDEDVARVLRSEYAIDVEWAGGDLYARALAKRRIETEKREAAKAEKRRRYEEALARLEAIRQRPSAAEAKVATETKWEEQRQAEVETILGLPPLPPLDIDVDDVLVAAAAYIIGGHQAYAYFETHRPGPWRRSECSIEERMERSWAMGASHHDVTESVLWGSGERPPFQAHNAMRDGLRESRRAVLAVLHQAADHGYLVRGTPHEERHYNSRGDSWFFTPRGARRVGRMPMRTAPFYDHYAYSETKRGRRHTVDVRAAARLLHKHPRPLFTEEVEALIPMWMNERRAAQERGMPVYRAWLADRRETGRAEMLWFTDDEVIAALQRLEQPVRTVTIMDALAPASSAGDRFRGEVARLSQQLVRLARDGFLVRSEDDKGKPIWEATRA